jgi:hypothetical protein
MEFGEILSRAWKIIWQHKILWVFGILASCASGNGGTNFGSNFTSRGQSPQQFEHMLNNIDPAVIIMIIAVIIVVALIFALIAIFVGTIGRIGMIRGTLQADQGAASLSFSDLFNGSIPYFWRVFGLNLLVGVAVALVFIILTVSIIGIPCLCLAIPASWVVGVILQQANIVVVVEDKGIMDALRYAWELFKANIGNYIIMALILGLGISMLGGLIIGLPFMMILGPLFFGMLFGAERAMNTGLIISLVCLVAFLPVAIVLGGILHSYIQAAWTLTYLRLTNRQAV